MSSLVEGSASAGRTAELERTLESVTILLAETRRMVVRMDVGGGSDNQDGGASALPSADSPRKGVDVVSAASGPEVAALKRQLGDLESAVQCLRGEQNKYELAIREVSDDLQRMIARNKKRDENLESENVRIRRENVRLAATLKRERTNTQAEFSAR